jgi:hypothetical protein
MAINSQKTGLVSDSEDEPLPTPPPGLIHSTMSLSYLMPDSSGSLSKTDEYTRFTDHRLYDINYSPLILPSELLKSNIFQNSGDNCI